MQLTRLGQVLLKQGLLDPQKLEAALSHHRRKRIPLGRSVVALGYCSPEDVTRALATQYRVGYRNLLAEQLDPRLSLLFPQSIAEEHGIVPLQLNETQDGLFVAMRAPLRFQAIDAVRRASQKQKITPFIASDEGILTAIAQIYGTAAELGIGEHPVGELPVIELMAEEQIATAPSRPVLLFGWSQETTQALIAMCQGNGIQVRTATASQALRALQQDIVLSPLHSLESFVANGQQPSGQWVVTGHAPDKDARRARRLGAKAYLPTPVIPKLLMRTLERLA